MTNFKFRVFDILFILALLIVPALFSGVFGSTLQLTRLIASVVGFYAIGEVITFRNDALLEIVPMVRSAIKVILGGILYALILMLYHGPVMEYLLYGAGVVALIIFQKELEFDTIGFVTIIPFFIFFLNTEEYRLASAPEFIYTGSDYFYYTTLVQSIASNFDLNNAIFHNGLPINFQSLPYIFPAAVCFNMQTQAHLALLAFTMPLYKLFAFGAISAGMFCLVRRWRGQIQNPYLIAGLISVSLILLAPLNPIYLLRFDFQNFIFLGEGYLLPMGSPGFALGLLFFGVLNFYFFSTKRLSIGEIASAALLLGTLIAIKIALFIPLFIFYASWLLLKSFRQKRLLLYDWAPLVLGGVVAIMSYWFFLGDLSGITRTTLTLNGYLPEFFQITSKKYGLPWGLPTFLGMLGYMILMWMGLKWLLATFLFLRRKSGNTEIVFISIAALMTVCATFVPALFVRVMIVDELGATLQDATFDMGQFLRAGIFILNAFSTTVIALLFIDRSPRYIVAFRSITVAWFFIAACSLFLSLTREVRSVEGPWYGEVVDEYRQRKPKLMAIQANRAYSGQVLCAKNVYPWWTSVKRGDESGYIGTVRVNYRNALLYKLLDPGTSSNEKAAAAAEMKKEGVDYLVATPDNIERFKTKAMNGLLKQHNGDRWLFELNEAK
jgi:hypothetical protein